MNQRIFTVVTHLLGCLLFLALPYLFAEDGFAKLADLSTDPHERRNVLSYLFTIAFFYTNYFVLIPRLFFPKRYPLFALSVLVVFLLFESLLVVVNKQGGAPPERRTPALTSPRPMPPPGMERMGPRPPFVDEGPPPQPPIGSPRPTEPQPGLPSELSQTFFLMLAGLLMALVLRTNDRWRETEREKIQTELSYLKAQINPHFLFNTLNSIYSLAIIESPPTADALANLSSFLRYVIQDSQKDRVSLAKELDYIGQYITLQRLRLGDTATIDFTMEGHSNGKQIVPLLLISFIENAFKYGVSPEEPSPIQLRIILRDNELNCHVFNKKVRVFQPTAVASVIGLANTQARLQLLYPNRHRLIIQDKPDSFTVDLSLTLS